MMIEDAAIEFGRIELTERDIKLFRYLNEQKFMISSQIYKTFWPQSKTRSDTARQRLVKLEKAGYLKVIRTDRKTGRYRLYLLTGKGIDVLRKRKLDHGFREIEDVDSSQVDHALKLTNIRAFFEALGQTNWTSERIIRKEIKRRWFPDGVLEIYGLKVAIELENSFKDRERYSRRFKEYEKDEEFTLAMFVISWQTLRSWLLELEAPQHKVCFVFYDDLFERKKEAELMNKTSSITLGSIL